MAETVSVKSVVTESGTLQCLAVLAPSPTLVCCLKASLVAVKGRLGFLSRLLEVLHEGGMEGTSKLWLWAVWCDWHVAVLILSRLIGGADNLWPSLDDWFGSRWGIKPTECTKSRMVSCVAYWTRVEASKRVIVFDW